MITKEQMKEYRKIQKLCQKIIKTDEMRHKLMRELKELIENGESIRMQN